VLMLVRRGLHMNEPRGDLSVRSILSPLSALRQVLLAAPVGVHDPDVGGVGGVNIHLRVGDPAPGRARVQAFGAVAWSRAPVTTEAGKSPSAPTTPKHCQVPPPALRIGSGRCVPPFSLEKREALVRCGRPCGVEKAPCSLKRSWRAGQLLRSAPSLAISTVSPTRRTSTCSQRRAFPTR